MAKHFFTLEQAEFIRNNIKGISNIELTQKFNAHFSLHIGINQMASYKKKHKLTSGLDGRFKPGQESFNKGLKGVFFGGEAAEACQFKKGNKAWNWVPLGSERVNRDGYVDIKVADGKKQKNWKGKHIVIWEAANGPVPKGHAVIFGDGDKRNFDLNNLLLVTRKQLVRLNQKGLIQNNAELTKTGIIIADIYNKIGSRKRNRKDG